MDLKEFTRDLSFKLGQSPDLTREIRRRSSQVEAPPSVSVVALIYSLAAVVERNRRERRNFFLTEALM